MIKMRNAGCNRYLRSFALLFSLWPAMSSLWAQQAIRINAGGASSTFTSAAGEQWLTDRYFSGGDLAYTGDALGGTSDRYLYATGRTGLYGDFEYNIPVANGSYNLTLKFAETFYWYKGNRVFNVVVNGSPVLTNFDILNEVPARTALDKTFPVTVTNGTVKVRFQGVVHYGLVSGIELEPSTSQPVTVAVSPAQAALTAGQTQQFTAAVGGTGNTAVTWSASAGTISAAGLFTAPATIAAASSATVTATSVADPTVKASATVDLKTPVQVSVTPSSGNVTSGLTLQLNAAVTGTSDTRVTWSASTGTVSATGLFTAPTVSAPAVATITAHSVADASASAVALITVNPVVAADPNPTFLESNGMVVLEAEDASIVNRAQSWLPQTGFTGFSGTAYLSAQPNSGMNNSTGYVGVSPEAQFRVKFAQTGTYYVWVRAYSTGPADDSINIGLDGAAVASGETLSMFPAGTWAWSNQKMDNVGRVTLNIASAGVHTINVWMREDGFNLDKLVLATSSTFTPTGLGPGESPIDTGLPVLNLTTANLSFSAVSGGSPASQTVGVTNLGAGNLSWTAASNQPWLAVSPASGSNASTLTISANAAGLAPGNYTGAITVTAPGATGSPKTINVSLSVTAMVQPALRVSPASLSFTAQVGGSNPLSQSINVTEANGSALNWTASDSQSWLGVSAASGTAPATVAVSVNIASLAVGTYNGAVTITGAGATGSPQTVNVTLTVQATAPPPPVTGNQWHVAPNGSSGGDGSQSRPWDMRTALNGPSAVKPGDTIWVHGGTYGGNSNIYNSYLRGTAAAPIVVRAYPGERATVLGGIATYSPYTWYWGLEIMNTNPDRGTGRGAPECFDTYDNSVGVKIINMVLHDCTQGLGFWRYATDAEAHGNVIFYNGYQSDVRGAGHGIYTQNGPAGTKLLQDNIIFDQFGMGIQAYGSGNTWVQDITADGNIVFNNGSISSGSIHVDNIIFAGGALLTRNTLTNNYTYHTPSLNDGYSRLGWQYSTYAGTVVAQNNYWVGGESSIELWYFDQATFTGNYVYGKDLQEMYLKLNGNQKTSNYTWDNNKYFGSGRFTFNDSRTDFNGWRSATGLDRNSTFSSGAPRGVWAFARPNKYEPGRGNIAVYNWDLRSAVDVDVSSVVRVGAQYEVRDAQNFYGTPVATGTYNGGTISIPMTGMAKMRPVGSVPHVPEHTGVDFGAFVIFSR